MKLINLFGTHVNADSILAVYAEEAGKPTMEVSRNAKYKAVKTGFVRALLKLGNEEGAITLRVGEVVSISVSITLSDKNLFSSARDAAFADKERIDNKFFCAMEDEKKRLTELTINEINKQMKEAA